MVVADLHVHTTNSDGTLAPTAVPEAAKRAGVRAVGLTDHDRLQPGLPVPLTRREDVTLISGIELRVAAEPHRVDLLGYGVRRTDDLVAMVERIQHNRVERGRAMVACLEDRLDVTLDVALTAGVGRPHIARAVADVTDLSFQDVFDRLIGHDGPCYVARDVPSFTEGLEVLRAASGLVALAHPLRYDDPAAALALCADLDAVERWYPYERLVDEAPVDAAIDRYGLVPVGGSDAHDDRLGRAGLDEAAYTRFRDRISLP